MARGQALLENCCGYPNAYPWVASEVEVCADCRSEHLCLALVVLGVVLRAARSTQHTVMHGADGRAAFKAEHFVSGSLIPPQRSHVWLQIYHTSDKRRDEMGHMMRQGGRAHHTCPAREHGRGRLCCCPPAARSPQPASGGVSQRPSDSGGAGVWCCAVL
ncbi:hypothetical protein HBH61_001740 [Parastagonospora nodorum]|nr:hypothetical protein HBH61_001740 [Parastagonospora nodorum]KAH4995270.1 hypothetical protein HBI76_001100 [Parastagonospora nodorum]KAH5402297.1 hypothetical protein HBI32_168910 [Parastagonospora nodorum]